MTESSSAKKTRPAGGGTSAAGMRETIQSILIALIGAFIFRAFVVEAFVIPTGSMATTLLGAHVRFNCEDCGYRFDHNVQTVGEAMRVERVARGQRVEAFCPNCQFQNELVSPAVYYGDRIMVLKYLYLVEPPQRWDVVVFKSPHDPAYEVNYIKRLVGNPGEQVMILDGDIYVRRGDEEPWQVQTKPRHVQEALWRIVYDNDYQPHGLSRRGNWQNPWQQTAGQGWRSDAANPRLLHFDNLADAGTLHFEPQPLPVGGFPIDGLTDRLAYNVEYGTNAVSDLKLELHYQRHEGDGPLRLRLSKRDHTFTAEIGPDRAAIYMQVEGEPPRLWQGPVELPRGRLAIEFSNVDYRVTLRVNGRNLIRADYPPDVEQLIAEYERGLHPPLPRVEIEAAGQRGTIAHLQLWRDIYYIARGMLRTDLRTPIWGRPLDPIVLGEGEYFVLGDNSSNSLDARQWASPVHLPHEDLWVEAGRVPERFMLGKAFFVYWPAGYRPLTPHNFGLVPNFAQMRFIH